MKTGFRCRKKCFLAVFPWLSVKSDKMLLLFWIGGKHPCNGFWMGLENALTFWMKRLGVLVETPKRFFKTSRRFIFRGMRFFF